MYTQCSNCETVFKLSAEVLRAAGGQVRCGKCGEVFNALAHLAEDASAFSTGETALDLETRADNILESSAAQPRRAEPEAYEDSSRPDVEVARLQILDWSEAAALNAQQDASTQEPEEVSIEFETSMEFTLPPGELDRIFVESKSGKRVSLPVMALESKAVEMPPHAEQARGADSGLAVSEDVRREMLAGIEPSPAPPVRPYPALEVRRAPSFKLWAAAAIAFALLLLAQVVHQNRIWLAAHGPAKGALLSLYALLGNPIPSPANLSAYQLRQWGVTGDPGAEGTLRVRASILNTSAQAQPYPLLRVSLANRFGGRVGTRDFEATEYLSKPPLRPLAPGQRVDATMDILDPGKSAEGFEIDVCLRGADKMIFCAGDAAATR